MVLTGNPVSKGVAIGPLYLYQPFHPQVEEGFCPAGEQDTELARFACVKEAAAAELQALVEKLSAQDMEKAKIFTAHEDILNDVAMVGEIEQAIQTNKWRGDWAIWQVFETFVAMLAQVPDPLIQERVTDLKDVRSRMLRIWCGAEERNLSALDAPAIVVAHDLLPSDTATLDRSNVLAILTEVGGSTSHSAIIARSYEIPAVLGIKGLLSQVTQNQSAAVDALTGTVILEPTQAQREEYTEQRRAFLAQREINRTYLDAAPRTADGTYIDLGLNIVSADAHEMDATAHVDYVGLFRTEFLYMGRSELPGEEEQFEVYQRVLSALKGRPVTLRTLDIGGDKTSECLPLPKEDNPFLGNRALRLCFSRPDLFRTQLRAALRASVYGNLWLMLPMVGSMEDIRRAKEIIASVRAELLAEGKTVSDQIKVGIMIEIPSIALLADQAAKEVDFASIGSNDLCQYLTATDRGNPQVSSYYQSYHPALFRIMATAVAEFTKAGKPISICGELGGDALAAPVLVGLGMRKLSMGLASVPEIKRILSTLTLQQAQELARAVCQCADAGQAQGLMRAFNETNREVTEDV